MQATETTALTTTSHPPKVWEHHIDDVFSVIENPTYMTFFNTSTAFTPRPSSFMETEENSHPTPQLPFLDTLIQRNRDNTISVRVYRKPHTHTPISEIHISPSSQSKEKRHHITIRQSKEHHQQPFRPRKRRKSSHSSTSS